MMLPRTVIRGSAFVALLLFARGIFADVPIPGTFHVVCGAAPKDGVLSAIADAPIVFEADAGGAGFMYSWQFSDGSSDTGFQVTHAFPTGGRQTVSLSVVTPGSHEVGSTEVIQVLGLGAERPVLIIVGAGYTGDWDTEVIVTNPLGTELRVTVNPVNLSTNGGSCNIDPCPPPGPAVLTLPAHGQGTFHFSELRAVGVSAVYLSVDPGEALPVARARAYAVDTPSRAMGLPIVSAATLASRPPGPFVFPGAARSSSAHSNLVVVETSDVVGASASFLIEAVNGGGETVASTTRSLQSGQSGMIPDLLGVMGVTDFDGSIRVTQTSGSGIINGALATLTTDGGFAVSEGFNP